MLLASSVETYKWSEGESYLMFLERLHLPQALYYDIDSDDQKMTEEIRSGITVETDGGCLIQDFIFTGWGGKFEAAKDSAMTGRIAACYDAPIASHDFILEGGAIESNGEGLV